MLEWQVELPAPVPEVFEHCRTCAGFEQLFPYPVRWREAPARWTEGDRLDFSYRMLGVWLRHRAEVVELRDDERFVDQMVGGPYRVFRHTHTFRPSPTGGTVLTDRVQVESRLGRAVDHTVLRWVLERAFRQRHAALRSHFDSPDARPDDRRTP
jgi:ligand-binding SRPBCC domain-containing protein